MRCEQCGTEIPSSEARSHAGRTLCEDCYLDVVAAPKTCDPWAVYTAQKEIKDKPRITALQQQIVDLLKTEGPLTAEQACRKLGIDEVQFRADITALRHMELTRAFPKDGQVFYTLFNNR